MNIAVLIKQVPGSTNVEIDPKTGTLKRSGVAGKMNPYDLFSLEMALSLRERCGGSITVITMGPNQAESVVREAVYMGCNRGFVVSDRRFAGADVLATSRTLAGALQIAAAAEGLESYDLILCGKQTTDGDTAQVGAETAERLGLAHVANVLTVEAADAGSITVRADMGAYEQTLRLPLPCLLTCEKDINTPRLPSIRRKYALGQAGGEELVKFLSLDDFTERNPKLYGLNGSPTQVERIFPPEVNEDKQMYTGGADELSAILLAQLREMKLITKGE